MYSTRGKETITPCFVSNVRFNVSILHSREASLQGNVTAVSRRFFFNQYDFGLFLNTFEIFQPLWSNVYTNKQRGILEKVELRHVKAWLQRENEANKLFFSFKVVVEDQI